jgi:hypothetical protein
MVPDMDVVVAFWDWGDRLRPDAAGDRRAGDAGAGGRGGGQGGGWQWYGCGSGVAGFVSSARFEWYPIWGWQWLFETTGISAVRMVTDRAI